MAIIRGRRCSIDQLKKMREAGMGTLQIARFLSVDPSTVRYWLIKAGLPTKLKVPRVTEEDVDHVISTFTMRKNRQRYQLKRAAE